jgi:hypothetical protein
MLGRSRLDVRQSINVSSTSQWQRTAHWTMQAKNRWEPDKMPWTPDDAERHTHKATTWALKELWAKVANECLERTGDEGRAVREANTVVARQAKGGNH